MKKFTVFLLVALFLQGASADRNQDGDPLSDTTEDAVCGFPDVRFALSLLGGLAGSCTGSPDFDYTHAAFGDEVSCTSSQCSTQVAVAFDVLMHDDIDVESISIPPVPIEEQGPFTIGPLGFVVATVEGYKQGTNEYCVQIASLVAPPPLCLGSPLLNQFGPNTGPVSVGEVEETDVGPTPGFEEGDVHETPAQHRGKAFLDLEVVAYWNQDRLHRVVGLGDVELWEPVLTQDAGEVLWWQNNPTETRLEVHYDWHFQDGNPVCGQCHGTHTIPYLGQVYGAATKSP